MDMAQSLGGTQPARSGAGGISNYLWRLFATGACFAIFGIGGVLVSVFVFPLMRLLPGGENRRRLRARRLIRYLFGAFIGLIRALGIMTLEIHGAERLRASGGTLVVANHPTLIDVLVLLSIVPNADCVVKAGVWRNVWMRGMVREAGYISNESPESLLDDCARALQRGGALVIFPEGTRTVPGRPLRFVRGAAHIALRSGGQILPVLLHCEPSTLHKGLPWYRIPSRPFHFRVDVQTPLCLADLVEVSEPESLAARHLTESLHKYFASEIESYERSRSGDPAPNR